MGLRLQKHTFSAKLTDFQSLKNGLRLAFIKPRSSGKDVNKASISVTLNQGHFHASEFPEGFAHLYEHMLFNASTKYEKADALDNHLFTYHGQVNGWTQDLCTNFQMNCDYTGFEKACDIFIDRLTAPLFLGEHIEKEISAIHAEFTAKKGDDVRQLLSVQKVSGNQTHPFCSFSIGNSATLGLLSTAKTCVLLQKYHQRVMQGKHLSICIGISLNDGEKALRSRLTKQLCSAFATLSEYQHTHQADSQNWGTVYLPQHLNKFIQVKLNNTRHQLISTYIIYKDTCTDFEKHRPALYLMLSHLLESKHEHGLFHLLNTARLANDIHSYYKTLDDHCDELVVSIQLSDEGAQIPQTIHQYIQAFINFLCQENIEPWRFQEKERQSTLSLNVNRGSSLLEDCIEVSQLLSKTEIDTHDALHNTLNKIETKNFQIPNKNPIDKGNKQSTMAQQDLESWQLMPDVLSRLNNEHARVYFISPLANTNMQSPHYDTPYREQALTTKRPDARAKTLGSGKDLYFVKPRQNPYTASEYPLVKKQVDATQLLHFQSKHTDFKFYQDIRFNLPSGECYISITEPEMFGSVAKITAKKVWLSCLNEYLASTFFDVELASIHYRVYAHHHGISIHTGGLSERQLLLCVELINAIRQFKASKENIAHHLHKALATINNRPNNRPINQLFSQLNGYYQRDAKKQNATPLDLEDISVNKIFAQQTHYFKYNFIESLLIGNWQIESAKGFYKLLSRRFNAMQGLIKPKRKAPPVAAGQHIHLPLASSKENCVVWHYIPLLNEQEKAQVGASKSLKLTLSARALVLEKLLSHTIFDVLRQQFKMGYELGVGYKPISRYPGIAMYAVSQTHSSHDIYQGMQQAIKMAKNMLVKEQVFIQEVIEELTKQVNPRESDISQTASRTWLHFEDDNPILGYAELVDALSAINKNEMVKTLDNLAHTNIGQVTMNASALEPSIAGKLVS
jgi:insulysin